MPGLKRQQSCLPDKHSNRANAIDVGKPKKQRWHQKKITCPQLVKEYNKNIGGMDLADARQTKIVLLQQKIQKVVASSFLLPC